MNDMELYTNPDHNVWAAEICRRAVESGFDPSTPGGIEWMAMWIANAMMQGHDRALGTFPVVLPDGSAFVIHEGN